MDHREARSRIAREPNGMLEGALRPLAEVRADDDPSHLVHALDIGGERVRYRGTSTKHARIFRQNTVKRLAVCSSQCRVRLASGHTIRVHLMSQHDDAQIGGLSFGPLTLFARRRRLERDGQSVKTGSRALRTATTMAQLLAKQGRAPKARKLLTSTYDKFTQGFQTADLRIARGLLSEL
jgi:hypothetical protein